MTLFDWLRIFTTVGQALIILGALVLAHVLRRWLRRRLRAYEIRLTQQLALIKDLRVDVDRLREQAGEESS